ncbi:MAG: hypothetical protein Q8M24_12740 [Pseudolabrys sp.]|nr:hypothetical protein [Pseudolabrys sp.]MDP2296315.1 hypothetical protein [Pseudolabrys sp.]
MSRTLVPSLLVQISLVLVSSLVCSSAFAHDAPISRGGYKNLAGEWCCGAGDCGIVAPNNVKVGSGGYALSGPVTYGASATGNEADGPTWREDVNEVVPYSKALPSPDGAYWRCKRPDGSPRCFFAPPSGS